MGDHTRAHTCADYSPTSVARDKRCCDRAIGMTGLRRTLRHRANVIKAQLAFIHLAEGKARTAVEFRGPQRHWRMLLLAAAQVCGISPFTGPI
jgi:hypothetical protein